MAKVERSAPPAVLVPAIEELAPATGTVRRALELVLELLRGEIARMRGDGIPVGEDEYRGLYIAPEEAERLAQTVRPLDGRAPGPPSAARAELDELIRTADGPLGRAIAVAGLTPFDAGCLLLALASEADLGLERLVAYVQDDVSKRRPRVELALRLFGTTDGIGEALERFHGDAPLARWRLLSLHDEPGQPQTPLLAQSLALDPRITAFLLEDGGADALLLRHLAAEDEPAPPAAVLLDRDVAAQIDALGALPVTALAPPVVHLPGPDPARTGAAARALAARAGLRPLSVDFASLHAEAGLERGLLAARREAALERRALLLRGLETIPREDAARVITELLGERAVPLVLILSDGSVAWPGVTLPVPALDFDARRDAWARALAGEASVTPADLDAIAGKFRLGMLEIERAAASARGSARLRSPAAPAVVPDDVYAAARAQSTPILNTLSRKITPHYGWDDIVLTVDTLSQLREICGQFEHRHLVFDTWGFDRKLALGKGLIALFAGPSGTGKTMAADIIAGTLRLDLYKIDLSGVVSKYIGETEKNLASIFNEAETSNAILFFDEADALFGKRSEVKDAHDRYANIETAYLLQRMEEYSGPVILATNLRMNLDEAFMRRLHFVVDFALPEEEERKRIWQATFPQELPRDEQIDFGFLARQFKVSGGNIRNIVLAAAFLAAGEGRPVGMPHLVRATRREYQKLGKMVTETDFGPYIAHLRYD